MTYKSLTQEIDRDIDLYKKCRELKQRGNSTTYVIAELINIFRVGEDRIRQIANAYDHRRGATVKGRAQNNPRPVVETRLDSVELLE